MHSRRNIDLSRFNSISKNLELSKISSALPSHYTAPLNREGKKYPPSTEFDQKKELSLTSIVPNPIIYHYMISHEGMSEELVSLILRPGKNQQTRSLIVIPNISEEKKNKRELARRKPIEIHWDKLTQFPEALTCIREMLFEQIFHYSPDAQVICTLNNPNLFAKPVAEHLGLHLGRTVDVNYYDTVRNTTRQRQSDQPLLTPDTAAGFVQSTPGRLRDKRAVIFSTALTSEKLMVDAAMLLRTAGVKKGPIPVFTLVDYKSDDPRVLLTEHDLRLYNLVEMSQITAHPWFKHLEQPTNARY